MATIQAERLARNPMTIGSLLKGAEERLKSRVEKVIPWNEIWDSNIPHGVIMTTAGHWYRYQATFESVLAEKNAGVLAWRAQTKRALLDHLNQTPQSEVVLRSLRATNMALPVEDPRESISMKCRRWLNNITGGKS